MARPRVIPPPGWYDPALDAQLRASRRGLGDLRQDTELGNARAAQDYTFGVEDLRRGQSRGLADLSLGRSRGFEDLTTERNRGIGALRTAMGRGYEDYGRNVGLLKRSYQQLGRRQAEGARSAGVLSGSIALKAAQARAENQAIERQPMDTAIQRMHADNTLQQQQLTQDVGRDWSRLNADTNLASGRLREDTTRGVGQLGLGYARGTIDRGTALDRASREAAEFGLDVGEQQRFQAIQAGWNPPPLPSDKKKRRPFHPNQSIGWWGGPGSWGGRAGRPAFPRASLGWWGGQGSSWGGR